MCLFRLDVVWLNMSDSFSSNLFGQCTLLIYKVGILNILEFKLHNSISVNFIRLLIVLSLSRWVSPGALLSLYILLIPSTLDYCH